MRRFSNRSTKMEFPTFRGQFGALNATICWFILHKLFTIEKYEVSAFTGKKINVSRQKLIENERNEILKLFNFFQKKKRFFRILKIPWKKQLQELFFFEKFIQLQNCLESLQIIFRTFWRYLWKGLTSHLTILRL